MTETQPLLKPAQAAKYLAVSVKLLREITSAGRLPYVSVGNGEKREMRRYDQSDLDAYREANKRCQSTGEKVKQNTATTSKNGAFDIQAARARLRAGTPSASKLASKTKPKSQPKRQGQQP